MTIFNNFTKLNQGKIMALDVGSKRIGIATSDETRTIATPKLVLTRQSNEKDFVKISEIILENKIVAIVVGMPLNMDGSKSHMSEFVEKFSKNLDEFLEKRIPIFYFDERLTSFEARRINASGLSRKKEHCDDIAAALILEDFLSTTRSQ